MALPIVARCEKCEREFVYVNEGGDMRCHFVPMEIWYSTFPVSERQLLPECGGKIALLELTR